MNPLRKNQYKRLCNKGFKDLADKVNEIAGFLSPSLMEPFSARPEDAPMGVSAWKNHGIKYGYWNHFKQEAKKDIIEELLN